MVYLNVKFKQRVGDPFRWRESIRLTQGKFINIINIHEQIKAFLPQSNQVILFVLGIIRYKIFGIYISVYTLAVLLKKIICSAQR